MKKYLTILALSVFLTGCQDAGNSADSSKAASTTAPTESAAVVAASSVAVGQQQPDNPNWKTYRVATEATYPPFQFRDETGLPIGFEVELLHEVAKAGEFNITWIHTKRRQWLDMLNNDHVDVWSSSFTVSPEDSAVADFSVPFAEVENVVHVVDDEKNKSIQSVSDLQNKKISVSKYSKSGPTVVGKITGSVDNAVRADTFYLALKDLYAGQVDGVFGQNLVLAYYAKERPETKTKTIVLGEPKKSLAFVVKKGNKEVVEKLNAGLNKVKADGTYDQLVKKWFGESQVQQK